MARTRRLGRAGAALLALGAAAAGPAARAAPAAPPPVVSDLPVVEVPAAGPGARMVLLLTGDGGWAAADKGLSAAFVRHGVPVAAINSLHYFWKRRTPEETARDVGRMLAHYRAAWGRSDVLLVGYSRGADIVPIVAGRLPPEERHHLRVVAMLGPSTFAELEVHAVDLFTSRKRAGALPTEPAVRASGGATPVLCVYGSREHGSLCPLLADLPWVKVVQRGGGHRIRGEYEELAQAVLDAAP